MRMWSNTCISTNQPTRTWQPYEMQRAGVWARAALRTVGAPRTERRWRQWRWQLTLSGLLLQQVRVHGQVALLIAQRLDAGFLLRQLVGRVPRPAVILWEVMHVTTSIVSVGPTRRLDRWRKSWDLKTHTHTHAATRTYASAYSQTHTQTHITNYLAVRDNKGRSGEGRKG